MSTSDSITKSHLSTHRIEALGDGVFAIVMTLLVLDLHVPHLDAGGSLLQGLVDLWPKFMCYLISFITLGVYWVAHHLQFYTVKKANRSLLWLNILFLMCLGVLPFSTALLGAHYHEQAAVIFFATNMILIGLSLYLHWAYATSGGRLTVGDLDPRFVSTVKHVILIGPVVYVLAIVLSFVSTTISLALFGLVNLFYIIPAGAQRHLQKSVHRNRNGC